MIFAFFVSLRRSTILYKIGRIEVILQRHEVFLDTPRRHKAIEDRHASCLVVCAACSSTAERLLPDDGAGALLIVVHVAGGVAQLVGSKEQCLALLRESVIVSDEKFVMWTGAVAHMAPVSAYGDVVSISSSVFSKSSSS